MDELQTPAAPPLHPWPVPEARDFPLPPPVAGSAAPEPSHRSVRASLAAALLVAGLLIGAGATYGATRLAGDTVHIRVDNSPVSVSSISAEAVAQQLAPAVGTIIALQTGASSLGSGFVIGKTATVSYLITNNHVVAGSSNLHVVMPSGDAYTAALVGTDTLDDLAVVSVPNPSLPVATFGDSAQLKVGQEVVAIGSPLGDQGSVTSGIISSLHRTITASDQGSASSETLEDVLQTDASINPGNSGGPLADMQGRVVGVNVAAAGASTNIGYSIPANLAQQVAGELIAHTPVQHPFLGIGYQDSITAIEAGHGFNGPGVLVTTVRANTPAAAAGFHVGDILVAIDGVEIDNGQTLGGLLQAKHVGDRLRLTVLRAGKTITLTATLEERPSTP
jgi:putative serine protease PepD